MTDKEIIAAYIKQSIAQAEQIERLQMLLQQALARIKELEAKLDMNSDNSNKPPSSDGLNKKPAIPRKKGGKRGGKPGHKGGKLDFVKTPDEVVVHAPTGRCACGCCLSEQEVETPTTGRQVFDLPEQLMKVTEHRIGEVTCSGCGQVHKGAYPQAVRAHTQSGARIRALVLLLSVEQSVPVERVSQTIKALTGQTLNQATIARILAEGHAGLAKETEVIKNKILEETLAHADETGIRTAGALHWVHLLSSKEWTYFFVHEKRGLKALLSEESLISKFRGLLVSDFWKSYFCLADLQGHAMCAAHIIRELRHISEQHPEKKWAELLSALLMYLYHYSERGTSTVEPRIFKAVSAHYDRLIAQGLALEPEPTKGKRGRPKRTKAASLLGRLRDYKTEVLRFATELEVPFTNNLAERDIRPWKTKLKVSTCFRTFKGAQQYARIKGFCSTVRKQGRDLFQALIGIFTAQPTFAV